MSSRLACNLLVRRIQYSKTTTLSAPRQTSYTPCGAVGYPAVRFTDEQIDVIADAFGAIINKLSLVFMRLL
jgi:hypothetical protein